jgi:cobalamin synthase
LTTLLGVVAVLLVLLDALVTGALHFDGLADTADGFGGGQSREEFFASCETTPSEPMAA